MAEAEAEETEAGRVAGDPCGRRKDGVNKREGGGSHSEQRAEGGPQEEGKNIPPPGDPTRTREEDAEPDGVPLCLLASGPREPLDEEVLAELARDVRAVLSHEREEGAEAHLDVLGLVGALKEEEGAAELTPPPVAEREIRASVSVKRCKDIISR